MLRPDQQYSEYTDRYINWNGLIEEIKACINAVGGAAVVNSTQYEDSWRGLQLGLSQLRAQLQSFADSVNTNLGAAQALTTQKGQPNGIATLGADGILTLAQRPTVSLTAAQVGAISIGEKGIANGTATLGADGILTLAQRPTITPAGIGAIASTEKAAVNGVASLGGDGILSLAQRPPAEAPGTASGLLAAHTAASDPHSQYATDTDLATHTSNTSNPHSTTAAQVGAIPTAEKGAASGVATLGGDGILTSAQRPVITPAGIGAIASTEKAIANGVATLGADGLLTAAQVRNTNSGWITATLLNGWSNFGGAFAGAEYRLWSDGWVELRGLITRSAGIPAAGSTILVLPSGYRPSSSIVYAANGTNSFASIFITNLGEVLYQAGLVSFFSLAIPPFNAT